MYLDEQPLLSKLGRSGPDGLTRIVTFVLLTIRQPFMMAIADYPRVRAGDRAVTSLFGTKHRGLAEIEANASKYYDQLERSYHDECGEELDDTLVHILFSIPGLGAAKAGFITQMIYGVSGCIDGHNLKRHGLGERFFEFDKRHPLRTTLARINSYNRFCRKTGTQTLWDTWCNGLAAADPVNYASGDAVSKLHLTPLVC